MGVYGNMYTFGSSPLIIPVDKHGLDQVSRMFYLLITEQTDLRHAVKGIPAVSAATFTVVL